MSPARRTLTVTSDAGLCNRLRTLTSGKAIAEATGREFAMLWQPGKACGIEFGQLFENAWNVHADVNFTIRRAYDFTTFAWEKIPDLTQLDEEELFVSHFGWLIQPTRHAHHIPLEARAKELLDELVPIAGIRERVRTFKERFLNSPTIGVHMRRGDMLLWRPDTLNNVSSAMQYVDVWLETAPDARILLCTDDGARHPYTSRALPAVGIRSQWTKRYGARVICTNARLERDAPAAIQDALVDLLLLRSTDFFVGTRGSSFSEVAAFGRSVPVAFAAGPTPEYRQTLSWLERLRLKTMLTRWGYVEFGREVPYHSLFLKYRQRVRRQLSLWKIRR